MLRDISIEYFNPLIIIKLEWYGIQINWICVIKDFHNNVINRYLFVPHPSVLISPPVLKCKVIFKSGTRRQIIENQSRHHSKSKKLFTSFIL